MKKVQFDAVLKSNSFEQINRQTNFCLESEFDEIRKAIKLVNSFISNGYGNGIHIEHIKHYEI